MILEIVCVGAMEVNCYIMAETEGSQAIIIDPGGQERKIRQALDRHKLKAAFIINTHGHYDHIGADNELGVPVYVHKLDAPLLKEPMLNMSGLYSLPYAVQSEIRFIEDNQIIELGAIRLKALHLPGHTPGGIGLLLQKPVGRIAFTGDTLFCQGIGRSDLAGGSAMVLSKSIKERLFTLPADTKIYPGHGPSSTIGEEMRNNLI